MRPGIVKLLTGLVLALAPALPGCKGCLSGVTDPISNVGTQATAVLQDGIDKITTNLSSWQTVLQEMQAKLTADTQSTLRNEVTNLLQGSIAVANSSLQCDVDFIGHRVIQALRRLLDKATGKTPTDVLQPAVCSDVPTAVDYTAWQQSRVLKADIYGYDFDAGALSLSLLTGSARSDVSSRLTKSSSYSLTVNLGGAPQLFNGQQQKLQVIWKNDFANPLSEIPVVLPVTPLCQTRKVTVPAVPPLSFTPPKAGTGDNDFNGNGPAVTTQVSLSLSGRTALTVTIFMRARETQSDWTEVRGSTTRNIFNAEPGWAIDHVITPTSATDTFTASGHALITRNPGPPVESVIIQGDTDGDDVGRTSATVRLTTIDVWEVQTDHCLNPNSARALLRDEKLSPAARQRIESTLRQVPAGFLR
jgi:hypothetical protein